MKTLEDRIAGKCIHFNGISNKCCDAGIRYDSVRDTSDRPYKLPCLKNNPMGGGSCEKVQFLTPDQVKEKAEEILSHAAMGLVALDRIIKDGKQSGSVECPSCNGKLNYVKAGNGHIHAGCKCGVRLTE